MVASQFGDQVDAVEPGGVAARYHVHVGVGDQLGDAATGLGRSETVLLAPDQPDRMVDPLQLLGSGHDLRAGSGPAHHGAHQGQQAGGVGRQPLLGEENVAELVEADGILSDRPHHPLGVGRRRSLQGHQ
ncbi:MAG: hypothetical protein WCG47_16005 [Dermatophilaceae bacterium]